MNSKDFKPEESWDPANRIKSDKLMSMKQLKKINPFMDDEAYIAEKQVDMLRDMSSEVDRKYLIYVIIGNLIFNFGGIFIGVKIATDAIEANVYSISFASGLLLFAFFSRYFFKDTRIWNRISKRITLATRLAAFGEAYRSRYNLKLGKPELAMMLKLGAVDTVDVEGNKYRVLPDYSHESSACKEYSIIVRS